MTDRPAHSPFYLVAQRWRALVEQRRAHFADLYHSGRWRRYHSEETFLMRMREVVVLCERWAQIVEALSKQSDVSVEPPVRDAA